MINLMIIIGIAVLLILLFYVICTQVKLYRMEEQYYFDLKKELEAKGWNLNEKK
ncbi:hypothetical protein [Anaerolentibacter hominis]|uniref:hypothetical protein n=1 Tax=Anaerolentibacter hominis TaxID=3079009 RepID=UPI0031B81986